MNTTFWDKDPNGLDMKWRSFCSALKCNFRMDMKSCISYMQV
jgi:hypothetical protein